MDHFTTMLGNVEFIERKEQYDTVIEEIGYQPVLEREVVLRRLTPTATSNPRLRGHFLKEARALAALRHPNIVEVYDAGVDQNNLAYMILERPDGITLEQRLDILNGRRARLDPAEVSRIMGEVTAAIDYAHQHSILVSNLLPTNLVLAHSGRVILTGLGQPFPENIVAAPIATLAYAAPERLFGGRVEPRSDIYSLGILLYQLLFGRLPFEGNPLSILGQKQVAASLSARNYPEIELYCPAPLAQVLRQATAQEAADRFPDVNAFRAAFDRALLQRALPAPAEGPILPVNGKLPVVQVAADLLHPALHFNGTNGNGTNGNGRPKVAPALNGHQPVVPASPVPPAVAEPAEALAGPVEIDPLTPGYDDPALQAALPYTILVPMPEAAAVAEVVPAPAAATPAPAGFKHAWLVWTSLAGLLAVLAAINFG